MCGISFFVAFVVGETLYRKYTEITTEHLSLSSQSTLYHEFYILDTNTCYLIQNIYIHSK